MMPAKKITVIIADDQQSVRVGLRMNLALEPDIEVIGLAEDGAQAIQLAHALKPDVVIMDLRMPVMDGLLATREIKAAQAKTVVIMLSLYDSPTNQASSMEAGAAALVSKHAPLDDLVAAIRQSAGAALG